jgi:hypothetical protein
MENFKIKQLTIILFILYPLNGWTIPNRLASENKIDLRDFKGLSFLQTMIYQSEGIVDTFDRDFQSSYDYIEPNEMIAGLEHFDKKRLRKFYP